MKYLLALPIAFLTFIPMSHASSDSDIQGRLQALEEQQKRDKWEDYKAREDQKFQTTSNLVSAVPTMPILGSSDSLDPGLVSSAMDKQLKLLQIYSKEILEMNKRIHQLEDMVVDATMQGDVHRDALALLLALMLDEPKLENKEIAKKVFDYIKKMDALVIEHKEQEKKEAKRTT